MGIFNYNTSNKTDEQIKTENNEILKGVSEDDKKAVYAILAQIKAEIYFINTKFTKIMFKFQNAFSEQNPTYEMTFTDFRYIYEELINYCICEYIQICEDSKVYQFQHANDIPGLNKSKDVNQVNIDFMRRFNFSSYLINQVMDIKDYNPMIKEIKQAITRICVYNHKMAIIDLKYYLKNTGSKQSTINDYKILYNTQMYTTIAEFLTHSNILKMTYFKNIAKYTNSLEKNK